jgi:hypothetical protein
MTRQAALALLLVIGMLPAAAGSARASVGVSAFLVERMSKSVVHLSFFDEAILGMVGEEKK